MQFAVPLMYRFLVPLDLPSPKLGPPRSTSAWETVLGATKVSGKDFLAIVTDRAEILRDGLEEGQDSSFWIIFQMMVRGALSKIDFSANARR